MNVTIIVPSLNPDEKLMQVVNGLREVGFNDIVLVNDGSDAAHLAPFEEAGKLPGVTVLTHEVNKGKGRAMKTAFAWCMEHRPDIAGVVTADGDNQHTAGDIRRCAEKLIEENDKVWLGVRDFSLEHVPARSRLGNNLTRFIMRVGCGVDVSDTQTGLRAIPAHCLSLMCEIEGERYEFETEMLIALREHGIGVGELVIETVYIDENQTSHFHPLRDSWKIYKIIFRHIFRRLGAFLRFSLSSVVSCALDYLLFTVFNVSLFSGMAAGVRELAATYLARLFSGTANYLINRRLVFHEKTNMGRSALRYLIVCVVQAGVSALLVAAIRALTGASELAETFIKIPVDLVLFVISYRVQKGWVYASEE